MQPNDEHRWKRTKAAFQEALDLAPSERVELLDRLRRDDTMIAREVDSMLEAHDRDGGFLSTPFVPIASADRTDVWTGEVLEGKYRIEERTGQGGMGAVYRATHLWTGRTVAVKIIAPQFMANAEFVERFKGEARAAGSLRHPNVVNVTDFGLVETSGRQVAYLVMEFLAGSTLAETLQSSPQLPVSTVVDVLEQLALAVDEAHAHRILHRDIKPSNIWLSPDGRGGVDVKVLDFGLAKLRDGDLPGAELEQPRPVSVVSMTTRVEQDTESTHAGLVRKAAFDVFPTPVDVDEGPASTVRHPTRTEIDPRTLGYRLTRAGAVLGTPAYMSPEQWQARPLTPASDIYSLGVVVYEMLAGQPPFSGEPDVLCVKHTEMPVPSVRAKRTDVSHELDRIVASALSKSPTDRPASAHIFAAAFRTIAEGEPALVQRAREVESVSGSFTTDFIRGALLVVGSLLIGALFHPWQIPLPGWGFVQFAMWMAPLVIFLLTIDVAAASRLFVDWKVNGVVRLLAVSVFTVRPAWILGVQVLATTERTVSKAIRTSRDLLAPVPSFARAAFLRRLLGGLLTLLAGLVAFAIGSAYSPNSLQGSAIGFGLAFLATCLVSNFVSAREGAARARLFRLASSLHDAAAAARYLRLERPSGLPFTPRGSHVLALGSGLLAASLVLGSVHTLFVPPYGPGPLPPQAAAELVPREENAWTEFHLAFEAAGFESAVPDDRTNDISSRPRDRFSQRERLVLFQSLAGYGDWIVPALSQEQRALVLANQAAIEHLLMGALRPRSQFSVTPAATGIYGQSSAPLFPARAVARLALARARMLIEEGKEGEGANLYVATYTMGTRFSDPSTGSKGAMSSLSLRRQVAGALLGWIGSGRVDPGVAKELLIELERLDSTIPDPVAIAAAAHIEELRSIEGDFLNPFLRIFSYTPGLRDRLLLGYAARSELVRARLEPFLKRWDVVGYDSECRDLSRNGPGPRLDAFSPGDLATNVLFIPEVLTWGLAEFAYEDRFVNAASRAMLIASAYRSLSGRFPETIEEGSAALGVTVPVDVGTGAAVDYQLIDGVPVVRASRMDITFTYGEPSVPSENSGDN